MNSALYDTAMRPAGAGRVSARSIQIGLGLLWLLDGLLQLQPKMFGPDFANGVILPMVQGQPTVVSSAMTHVAHLVSVQPALADTLFAAVQILIGVGLLVRETVKPALVLSFVWALGVWALGEGFGMLFTGAASPLTGAPGAALLYVAIGVLVWPRAAGPAASGPAAAEGPLGARGGKAIWAVVWSGMGILWLLPANRAGGSISGAIGAAVAGEPGWLAHMQLSVAHALGSGGGSVAVVCGAAVVRDRPRPAGLAPHDRLPGGGRRAGARLLDVRGGLRGPLHRPGDGPQHGAPARAAGAGRLPQPGLGRTQGRGAGPVGGGMATPTGAMA